MGFIHTNALGKKGNIFLINPIKNTVEVELNHILGSKSNHSVVYATITEVVLI